MYMQYTFPLYKGQTLQDKIQSEIVVFFFRTLKIYFLFVIFIILGSVLSLVAVFLKLKG